MKRVFHHYEDLEEFHAGMWRIVRGLERARYIDAAADLMRNCDEFESAMKRVLIEWPKSCDNALTSENSNRIAWLGHAGCCIELTSPEEATRAGWHKLNSVEQNEANKAAARVLALWLHTHAIEHTLDLFWR